MKWHEKHRNFIISSIGCLFILLFTYAAISKLNTYDTFKVQIGQSPILTAQSSLLVWMVPVMELLTAILYVIPRFRLWAFHLSLSLMTMFTVYIFLILKFSPYIPCSCGGVLNNLGWTEHLIFNIAFVLLAIAGVYLQSVQNRIKLN